MKNHYKAFKNCNILLKMYILLQRQKMMYSENKE